MNIGWEKYEIQVLNHEEELWNMELSKTSNEVEKIPCTTP
jgi:hypothetical protein